MVLLEAARLAEGSTAGSLGAIVPEPDASFRAVEAAAGRRVARIAWNEAQKSARDFATALKKLPTQVRPRVVGARDQRAHAGRRRGAAQGTGGAARRVRGRAWLSPAAARADIGTESAGALRLGDAFVFDPVRATLGLAGAAEEDGARIFEQSAVRRTRFTRKYADVVLASGSIRTRGIVVATGEPGTLFGQLRRHVHRETGYVVVTEPLSAAMRREAGRRTGIADRAGPIAPVGCGGCPTTACCSPAPGRRRRRPGCVTKLLMQRTAQLMYELSVRYPAISGLPAHWGWDRAGRVRPRTVCPGSGRIATIRFTSSPWRLAGTATAWRGWPRKRRCGISGSESRREDDVFGFARHL